MKWMKNAIDIVYFFLGYSYTMLQYYHSKLNLITWRFVNLDFEYTEDESEYDQMDEDYGSGYEDEEEYSGNEYDYNYNYEEGYDGSGDFYDYETR